MKKQIVILLSFLSLFVVLSSQTEATVTDGKVQYYFESSTANTENSTSSTSSESQTTNSSTTTNSTNDSSTTMESDTGKGTSGNNYSNGSPGSPSNGGKISSSGISRYLQTNDQRNLFLSIIGVLIVAIALLGWRIAKNRRKN
ncbi:LPXTG-motif cell wall anchor domain-containing protein [Enterococcus malodoratus]|uniref:LPXTG cell wall anchor domain-containing protein n=2 Tax=Enterococcus TaxID=1350 RepID=UPI0008D7A669|nr:LPXTG cell wall anchor domain-containing protein [Enterococcus malodoratus]SES62649.1 LPXTG-motif cell wall anchor domain-containing protein [Enterococcus malodoratus]